MKQPELGQKIVELRTKMGFTQEELVERCHINVRTLQRIESGKVSPRNYTVKIIFEALDHNVDDDFSNKAHPIKSYFENKIKKIVEQSRNRKPMKNSTNFFYNYFLSIGILWFFCALSIMIFKLNFQVKEILLTLIFPLAFAIFRKLSKSNSSKGVQDKTE